MPNWFNRKLQRPKIQHSVFDMSNDYKTSLQIGKLVPTYVEGCLPSDKFLGFNQSVFLRLAPMVFPTMHSIKIHTSNFFVPMRIILGEDNYEDFLNGKKDIVSLAISIDEDENYNPFINTVIDYLGYDINMAIYNETDSKWTITLPNPLPYLAYLVITRDWYMDSNIESSDMDSVDTVIDGYRTAFVNQVTSTPNYTPYLFTVSYSKDYFNTARPQPENGVTTYVLNRPMTLTGSDRWIQTGINPIPTSDSAITTKTGSSATITFGEQSGNFQTKLTKNDLNSMLLNEGTTIKDLWRKEMLQRYYEIDNTFGTRVREKLAGHFGVDNLDNRLQIPQYCGGSSSTVKISSVIQTSMTDSSEGQPLGQFGGLGIGSAHSKAKTYFCREHGYFISLLSLIPDNGYCNGMQREYFKQNIYDFASPEFNNIGWQPILKGEVFATSSDEVNRQTFAYQPRFSEYRSHPSRCTGDFRSNLANEGLLAWHLNRYFSDMPAFNKNFIKVADTSRIFNYQNESDVPWAPVYLDVYTDCKMSRPISYEPNSMHLY